MKNPMASTMQSASMGAAKSPTKSVSFGASMAGSAMFMPGSTNTVPMQFRGQERKKAGQLGTNPNTGIEDEYIHNLQQQIHFMELEMRIMKEKVVEDERKAGIGSLFDDEKTSWQHIAQMKQKYQGLRRNYDRDVDSMNRTKISTYGDQFVLDAQIDVMQGHNFKLDSEHKDYHVKISKKLRGEDKDFKDLANQTYTLRSEINDMTAEMEREQEEHYKMTMSLIKDKKFDEITKERH